MMTKKTGRRRKPHGRPRRGRQKKTYLSPVAFFNAGAAAEEQGKAQEAIEYYTNCLASSADFPGAPRAQFAIGRLQEGLHENAAALEAYRAVISGWPYNQVWVNLAHSRIIALEAETESNSLSPVPNP
jgi:tetratricopeptide (TPR) repeat protein